MYTPPFKITARAINLIAEISAMVERFAIRMEQDDALLLRKINRIKTIQGSLAIEGNTLTESQITDIIDGKHVVAPIREIQEVRNAIKTYNLYSQLDPYSVKNLLQAHGVMMEALTDDAGHFRKGGVGVFAGTTPIHIAPPASRVPTLIAELFEWLKKADDHLLIKSCVFHYEFEFIHPFSDGNGRTGRLWQSLILGQLHPVFEHLPIENMVYANQQGYYDAINRSTNATDSGIFVDFMLEEIYKTLKKRQGKPLAEIPYPPNPKRPSMEVHDNVQEFNHDILPIAGYREERNGVTQEIKYGTQEPSIITQEILHITQEKDSFTQEKILAAIRNNPRITRRELAVLLERTEDSIKYQLLKLTRQGIIKHVGATKAGEWKIQKENC
ncbi:MAG: Fic family protein [Alistipes sp.]|nr:Fic family protein [Alistipes sp.]